jgi:hypothetical protein
VSVLLTTLLVTVTDVSDVRTPVKSTPGKDGDNDLRLRADLRKASRVKVVEYTEEPTDFVITLAPEEHWPAGYQARSTAARRPSPKDGGGREDVKDEDWDEIESLEVVETTVRHLYLSPHVVYVVKVTLRSKDVFEVGKQYSHFLEFHTTLASEFRADDFVERILHMPGKWASLTKKSDRVIADRMRKFDVYLKALLEKCRQNQQQGEGEGGGGGGMGNGEWGSDPGMYDNLKVFLDVGQWAADFRRLHQSWSRKMERDQMKEQLNGLSPNPTPNPNP